MRRSDRLPNPVWLVLLASLTLAVGACGGGSSASGKGKALYLERFSLVDEGMNPVGGTGTSNAFRDALLLFEFSGEVDLGSVSSRTIRIGIPVGGDLWVQAPGQFRYRSEPRGSEMPDRILRDQVIFDPSEGNALGLDANSVYEIVIPNRAEQQTHVTGPRGDGIVKSFRGSFRTGADYRQNYEQPALAEHLPADGAIDVPYDDDVVLRFSEPMKPESFRLNQTIIVRNLTLDRTVLGSLRFSPDAKTVTFRPVFGYGKGPYTIFVRVTKDVTNLPGNPLPKEVRFQFVSALNPVADEQGEVIEEFDDASHEDTSFENQFPLADWNQGVTRGFLAGRFTTGTVTLSRGSNQYHWAPWAWGGSYSGRTQILHLSGEIGSARTITGFSWYKYCSSSQSVTNVTVNLGHTQSGGLTTNLSGNFSDTPVTVVNSLSTYAISSSPISGWTAGPAFTSTFRYNGTDNVVLEILATSGANGANNNTWTGLWRANPNDSATRLAYTVPTFVGPTSPVVQKWFYDTRYDFLIDQSEAQSTWYDVGVRDPEFLDVFLDPDLTSQPAGTGSAFTFQGAPENLDVGGVPDLANATQWVDDLHELGGFRYVRFHVVFKGNQSTNARPMFDSILFPFFFR